MTLLLFVFGVALFGVTGRLLARAFVAPRLKLKAHLHAIGDYGFGAEEGQSIPASRAKFSEVVAQLATRLGRLALARLPTLSLLKRSALSAAGFYEIDPDTVHGYRVMAALGIPLLLLGLMLLAGAQISSMGMLILLALGALGWQLPATYIEHRGRGRLEEIDRQLPELIDVLIATVEAGMGIAGSIALVAGRFHGALGDELKLMIKQQSLGSTIGQTLEDLVTRVDTPSVRAFVRTVTRAESLGSSISPILRELTLDMRRRRRQSAREKMQKAPVKMLFPLMFLIFPALMIELMYPAAHTVLSSGGL
jgi:tight adherence protein C